MRWLLPVLLTVTFIHLARGDYPAGWREASPRAETRPEFSFDPKGGPKGDGAWVLSADHQPGRHGWFEKPVPVTGGTFVQFRALRRTTNIAVPRRSALARVVWQDDQGKAVLADPPEGDGTSGPIPLAEPEYPQDRPASPAKWVEVMGIYKVPTRATRAVIELHLLLAPNGRVEWSEASLTRATKPPSRIARLATVHFTPRGGKTPADNCRMFEPFIAEAAQRKADLVVLGETATYVGLGKSIEQVAEPVPGPSTQYFAALAKKHNLYVVTGLYERDGPAIYNVAVLIGPTGTVEGKYRKVCLPRNEVTGGVTPGNEYPVFETRFGKLGLMVCYDGFFPEVARELSKAGAEVIAWPVWGCNPLLAAARACENHVYLVSSTYTDAAANWTRTAIYGHDGQPIVQAEKWGTVVVAEVDLSQRQFWRNNLGDFKAELLRERPAFLPEPTAPKR